MQPLSKTVQEFVKTFPNTRRLVIAFSGGVDSTVLLHAAAHARCNLPILAIHVNHQISPNAELWQAHCEQVSHALGVQISSCKVHVDPSKGGLEQAARDVRLDAIKRQMCEGDLLLTGHHQLDQLETFFYRLARGSGLKGLAAMSSSRPIGSGVLGRPFLTVTKEEIQQYADNNNLCWIEDESNNLSQYDRNFLRLNVVPALQKRWPNFPRQVSKTTTLLRQDQNLLSEYAQLDLDSLRPRQERIGQSLELETLTSWSEARQHAVLRHWLSSLGYRTPSQIRLAEINNLVHAREDGAPMLNWGDCELRRYRERLYCLPKAWGVAQVTFIAVGAGLKSGMDYTIIHRKELPQSTCCRPHGRSRSQSLKKLLQEYALEPWLREHIPLIMVDDRLAAVGDLWVEAAFYTQESDALAVTWVIA